MNARSYPLVLTAVLAAMSISISHAQGPVGVSLESDSISSITLMAGSSMLFGLVIRDQQQNVFEEWDRLGTDIRIELRGSRAESDSSMESWSADADAYSWTRLRVNDSLLTADSVVIVNGDARQYYTVPRTSFVSGYASLDFAQSRADTGMMLSCSPRWAFLRQDSPPITVHPVEHVTYLVDVTYSVPDSEAVYLLRPYEIVVRPRDRFLNDLPDEEIESAFTARFPGEFDGTLPGLTDIWSSAVPVTGWMHAILSSRIRRSVEEGEDLQWIEAFDPDHPERSGRATFQIFDHAPFAPRLLEPQDQSIIKLWSPTYTETFSWEDLNPRDPYSRVQISRFDSTTVSDEVRFSVYFLDAVSLARGMQVESDQDGALAVATISHQWLFDLIDQISGFPTTKEIDLIWYVGASDGLYETASLPRENTPHGLPGFRLKLEKVGDLVAALPEAEHFNLHQNYPNPFHEFTVVPVELRAAGFIRLRVYNLLGEQVAVLHKGMLPAGRHIFRFERGSLNRGVYVYRLESGKQTLVRRMLLR